MYMCIRPLASMQISGCASCLVLNEAGWNFEEDDDSDYSV